MSRGSRAAVLLIIDDLTAGYPYTVRTEVYGTYRSWKSAEVHAEKALRLVDEILRTRGPVDRILEAKVRVVPCLYADLDMLLDGVRDALSPPATVPK